MTHKEKAAEVVATPEAAIQKTDRIIIVGNLGRVNDQAPVQARQSVADFAHVISAAGLAPFEPLDMQPDGRVHRYRVQGDKSGSRNGWYVLHAHPVLAGAFGSWKTGLTQSWCAARREELTQAQRAELQRQFERMRQARAAEQAAVHDQARARAAKLWALARLADDAHPYLQRKRIRGFGVRQLNGALVVPARDAAGALHTLQFIGADGGKRFLSGGRIAGCYYAMGRVGNEVAGVRGLRHCSHGVHGHRPGYSGCIQLRKPAGRGACAARQVPTCAHRGLCRQRPGHARQSRPDQGHRGGAGRRWLCGCAQV